MNAINALFHQINQLSLQVDDANVERLLSGDIHLLHITNRSFNQVENNQDTENFNYFGYLWLNHELSRHICALSFNLSDVFTEYILK